MAEDHLSPDTVTVAVTRVDGGLTVLQIIKTEYTLDRGVKVVTRDVDVTPEYIEAQIAKRGDMWNESNGKRAVSWRIVDKDYPVADRTYRAAWKDAPGRTKPDHDMVKARNVHRDILRKNRLRLMDDLDIEYQRADEAADQQKKRDVAARKQKLRDVTADPRIEAADNVDALRALTLETLVGE
jgi:hypothetical protein